MTPEEYRAKPHWGHSCPEDAIEISRAAGAKCVVLFHHAPERTDSIRSTIGEIRRRIWANDSSALRDCWRCR